MNVRKAGVAPLIVAGALVLALATVGLVYGLWSETLLIEGTVHTGEVYAEWVHCSCEDGEDGGTDPHPDGIPKDVGSTSCVIDPENPQILRLVVNNAYPSYWNDCEVEFANTGTVPIKIQQYRITPVNFTRASGDHKNDGEIWVKYVDGIGAQMEPCPADNCEQAGSLKFHVEQPAKENYVYEFFFELLLVQWNEYEEGGMPWPMP